MCVHFPSLDLLYIHEAATGIVCSRMCVYFYFSGISTQGCTRWSQNGMCESCSACFLWHSRLLLLLAGMRVFSTPSQPLVVTPGMSSSHSRGCVVTPRMVSILASLLANRPKPLLLGPFSTRLPLPRSVSVTSAAFPIGFLGISLDTRLSMASVSSVTRACVPTNCVSPTGSI